MIDPGTDLATFPALTDVRRKSHRESLDDPRIGCPLQTASEFDRILLDGQLTQLVTRSSVLLGRGKLIAVAYPAICHLLDLLDSHRTVRLPPLRKNCQLLTQNDKSSSIQRGLH